MKVRDLVIILPCLFFACEDSEQPIKSEAGEELSGGAYLTTFDFSENAFGQEAMGLSTDQQTDFVVGNSLFRNNWVAAPSSVQSLDGLGPLMNAISCGSCHFKDGRARPPQFDHEPLNGLLFRLSIPGINAHGGSVDEPIYGGQLQDKAIPGASSEGHVRIVYEEISGTFKDGTTYTLRKPNYTFVNLSFGPMHAQVLYSPRIAQQIPGLGLLENVSEQTILSHEDADDVDGDGISGRANYVWDKQSQSRVIGRFGWKANQPSLLQQTAAAFNGDIGITSGLFPVDELSEAERSQYQSLPNGGEPEIANDALARVVNYIQTLSVPARRNWNDQDVLRGKKLFSRLGCASCHLPQMVTSNQSPIAQLNNQTIRPYTDLLLHDMGEGLADNRPDFEASGSEWRTPPLWGIGLIKIVNRHTYLLHDGRARNIEEAVLWHGGEAQDAQQKYQSLSATDRAKLIKFVESL